MSEVRKLNDHVVEYDTANQLEICVLDEPGQGNACHEYAILAGGVLLCKISFQNGPIKQFGVNGVTQEALLTVVIDRLRSFQAGPFSCRDNAVALTHCEEALMWLQRRTRDRIKRGVEGTNAK